MSIATPLTVDQVLESEHADVIRATLPLVGANIDTITGRFYARMFDARPALLRNLFNRGNQAQGAQQRALAASIATYASHLVDPNLPHPARLLSRIGHKHASLGITADQYAIVHEYLFAAIIEVLGADVVTPEVAAAWDRVYWMMADTLIDLERRLYEDAGVGAGQVFRRATVTTRVDDPSGVVVISVAADWPTVSSQHGGQYVSVGVTLPDGARQIRQYSVISAGDGALTFAVKPVAVGGGCPAGEVSNWIATCVRPGDLVDVSIPFGDLRTDDLGSAPAVLISAGIGVTPMNGILEHLVRLDAHCEVLVLHADRSSVTHPLRARQRQLVDALPNAVLELWYEDGEEQGAHRGRLDLAGIDLPKDASFFVCGNAGFVQAVDALLSGRGVDPSRVQCELFAPDEWLLGQS
ncbi:globin domain-containing protein [Rhodococcus sp. G-MC3]|uniref:globin domain-containing protein n=1 Tax=Rhodococcus sp. G-MC3 TaxID=3046209 RepID=UPI0024BB6382|nr:globin domain-containing protein [Rhodococcus sp. G-MC3]MDJ0396694.1 globin domain-containing protein [Rhodococcus sp. G-MC3]